MDRTEEFLQILKLSQQMLLTEDFKVKDGKYSLLLSKKSVNCKGYWASFTEGLKKLVRNITRMKHVLLQNRKDYVNLYSHLISEASSMSDKERDQIDYDVHVFMKNCTDLLGNYRSELNLKTSSKNSSLQTKEHFTIILSLIEVYLKSVCDIYTEQKAIRVKRACERQRLSRLTASFSSGNFASNFRRYSNPSSHSSESQQLRDVTTDEMHNIGQSNVDRRQNSRAQSDEHPSLTSQELQVFDQENNQLYDELTTLTDEVKVIGGKVMEIARLQEVFTEKVLQQEHELDRLSSTVVASTESIRDGNDQLREAIRKGAGFRVWVLLFIMTLALTILFLDWYNP